VFRQPALQKESRIEEGHLLLDVKSAINLPRVYGERKRNFVGHISGRVGTLYRRLGGTRELCGSTFRSRNRKTRAWTNSECGSEGPPNR
jgi:hypothetical protein